MVRKFQRQVAEYQQNLQMEMEERVKIQVASRSLSSPVSVFLHRKRALSQTARTASEIIFLISDGAGF